MSANPIRILVFFVSLLICAAGLAGNPPVASASPQENLLQASGVISVDRTTFFDEGKYINLLDLENDIAISDFTTSGGSMIALADSTAKRDPNRDYSPYRAMQIFIENVYGRTEGIPGFGFLCDKTASAANGASVSIVYDYVGDMKDIADPSFSVPVSIKATYTVRDGNTVAEEGDYQESYTGHPLVQIPKCFSHGVFFVGTDELDAHYEFFNAKTGQPIELGTMYVTATSLNRGEGFALPSAKVSACYVSNEAPDASRLYDQNGRKTPYDIIPGSLLYDKTSEVDNGYTTFIGCPDVYDSNGDSIDFADSIGTQTFYWRSVCFAVDNGPSNSIDAKIYAIKTASWSGTEGIAGDGYAANGSLWFATNFMTLTSAKPPAPTKSADKTHDVRLGDTITYRIAQQVNDLGATSFIRYESMSIVDTLPGTLRFESARLLDESGKELPQAGIAAFDDKTRTVSFEFAKEFCESGMSMMGETYYLEIETEVIDYPDDGTLRFANSAKAIINGTEQPTEEVVTELAPPELDIDKHVEADPSTANEYEFPVGSEVTFRATLTQTQENARAKTVAVSDTLPEGLELVPGSVAIAEGENASVSETAEGWTASLDELDFGETVDISYRAIASEQGNGTEVVNTVYAHAQNIPDGSTGCPLIPTSDDAEVFINSPRLVISEEALVSPLTGSAYERRVDDPVVFEVKIAAEPKGTIARDLTLESLPLPEGLAIVDGPDAVRVEGIDLDGESAQTPYPVHGDDEVHGEAEQRTISGTVEASENRLESSLSLNYLPADTPVKLVFECIPSEEANGCEILNSAVVFAQNASGPVTAEPAARVWVNSPRLSVAKQAPSLAYQVGDIVTYRIDASNRARGTVARNVVFEDVLETPGMELLRNSIVVSDQDGAVITDQIDIVQNVGSQNWKIETGKALVNSQNHRIWDCDDGGAVIEAAALNPLDIERERSFRIEYQALITDQALASKTATNSITATSDENLPATDTETVSVAGPVLGISKSADIGFYHVGDVAEYTIEVAELRTGETAHNVRIGDDLLADRARAVAILDDSISLKDERGRTLSGWDVAWTDNEVGGHSGFVITTNADLPDSSKIIVSYKARFNAKTSSKAVSNTAWTEADDAPRAQASCSITCADPDDTALEIEKASDRETYSPGRTARYELSIFNTDETEPARSIGVTDALESTESASIAKGSVVVSNGDNEPIDSAQIVYRADGNETLTGFSVETDFDLASADQLTIRYETLIDEEAEPGDTVSNSATASADNTGDASVEHEVSVALPSHDPEPIQGYKTTAYKTANPASGSAVEAGSEIAYLITVKNTGATTAPTVRIRDYIPAGASYLFGSASEGGAFTVATEKRGGYVEWVLTDVASDTERSVGFSVRVGENPPEWIVNEALYSASFDPATAGDPTLPDPDRATARTVHSVNTASPFGPIVNVVKSSVPPAGESVRNDDEIDYVLTVSNVGDAIAENVLVRDPVPEGSSYVPQSASDGGTLSENDRRIEWLVPRIEAGATLELSFAVTVDAPQTVRSIENQASFALNAADRTGSSGVLENTSNIVEHTVPRAGANGRPTAPKTGDGTAVFAIGASALIALAVLAVAAIVRSKRRKALRRMQRMSPGTSAAPPRAKAHSPKRRRHDYLRWR